MKVKFSKSATKTSSFIGDRYKTEYIVDLGNGEFATFQYQDYSSKINWGEREVIIKPNLKHFTIIDYNIIEDGDSIGRIKKSGWTHIAPKIEITNCEVYKFKKNKTTLFKYLFDSSNYSIQIENSNETIQYHFHKGKYFHNEWGNQRHKALDGEIELQENSLFIALIGFLLIELMLEDE